MISGGNIHKKETIKCIIHISDIHIRTGNIIQARYNEYSYAFNDLISKLKKLKNLENCIIIITGDIFHHKNQIESSGIDLFSYIIKQLTDLTEVFIIMGNHDYRQDNAVEQDLISALVKNSNYTNLHYLDKTGIYIVNNLLIGLVAINDVLEDGDTSGMVESLPEFPDPSSVDLSNITCKVALYHGIIIDDNNSFFKEKEKGIHVDWFKKYDIAILGDNHKQQVNNIKNSVVENVYDISERINNYQPVWGYSGSLIQQNFGESIKQHGYLLWDLENKKVISVDVSNNNAYCTFNFKNDKKNKDKDWFNNINDFNSFIDEHHFKNINIRFLSNENCVNISDITNILDDKDIEYNKFCYNDNLVKNDSTNTNENIENINTITSYNSPNKWYEYIETNGDKNIIGDYDWKNMLNNPEKIQIDVDRVPEILKSKVNDRNKKLLNIISKYINSIDNVENTKNNLKLQYLEWSWVLCYEENCWFNFENMDNNVGLLNADNGFGKSSFLEIICLSLFGEPMPSRHNKQLSSSIICQQKPKNSASRVKLVFILDNKKYIITRKFNYQKNVSKLQMQNELYYVNDNSLVKLKSGNAIKEWVSINIGNINTFLISSMLTQNSDKDFFSMKHSDQINLLDKALSLDAINVLVELLKQSRLAYSNIIDALEVQYLEVNSSGIEEVTKNKVDEYYEVMNNTKNDIKMLQDKSYKKLSEVNSYVSVNDEKDYQLSDDEINNIISNIKCVEQDIDITILHNEIGQITAKLDDSQNKFKDLKLTYNNNKDRKNKNTEDDTSRCYSSRSILWKFCDMHFGENNKGHQKYVHKCKEDINSTTLKNIEEEFTKCKEYFENNDNTTSIEELKQNNEKFNTELQDKNNSLNNIISETDKIINFNNIYTSNINNNLKEQKSVQKKINTTKDECNNGLDEYAKMLSKIDKKKKLLENNNNVLQILEDSNEKYIKAEQEQTELIKSIKDINDNDYPFNPDCKCCQAQPWRLLLVDLENKLEKCTKKIEGLNSIFKDNSTTSKDYSKIKKKQLEKNIDKFTKYIENFNSLKDNQEHYKEQLKLIHNYDECEKKITKFEGLERDNNLKLKNLEKEKNLLLNQIKKLENKIEACNKNIELKIEYEKWVLRKQTNDEDISYYFWFCDNLMGEYEKLLDDNMKLSKKLEDYNKNIENIELKTYWNNILVTKPLWVEYNEIKNTIDRKNNYLNNVSNKYVNTKKDYNNYQKIVSKRNDIHSVLEEFQNTTKILNHFSDIFSNFRNWLYKNKIIPLIIQNTNDIISKVSNGDADTLKIDTVWNDNEAFYWTINDGHNNPNIEKASGFQRFIAGLAIKITLSNIGISNLQCNQLFIDEGFTSCDRKHLSKVPIFINSLLNLYDSVLVVSHLQEIKDSVSITMNIDRNKEKSLSRIRYGNKLNITQSKIET